MEQQRQKSKKELVKAGFDPSGTVDLFDGRTGDKFQERVAIGIIHAQTASHGRR